jgi:hypothetical protein
MRRGRRLLVAQVVAVVFHILNLLDAPCRRRPIARNLSDEIVIVYDGNLTGY